MKVKFIEKEIAADLWDKPSTFGGPGLYVAKKEDYAWWQLVLVTSQVDVMLLSSDIEILRAEYRILFEEEPVSAQPVIERPTPRFNDEGEVLLFSRNDIQRLLAAAAGTLTERCK